VLILVFALRGDQDLPTPPLALRAQAPVAAAVASPAAEPERHHEGPSGGIFATAPEDITVEDLGRPFNARFQPWRGPESRSLFPKAQAKTITVNSVLHDIVEYETEEQLAASLTAWGITVGGGRAKGQRYASYRALQTSHITTVDDSGGMRTPPAGATYYLASIKFGHAYEAVFHGDEYSFHAGVRGSLFSVGGSVEAFSRQANVSFKAVGRGLVPDGDAIFAASAEDMRQHYRAEGEPVAVVVEYRRIPGVRVPKVKRIRWREPTEYVNWHGKLGEKQTQSWTLMPGAYQIEMRSAPNGATLDVGGDLCALTGSGTRSEKKQFSASCAVKVQTTLRVTNPTGLGLGPAEQVAVKVDRLEQER
jgi:hypothetical protein